MILAPTVTPQGIKIISDKNIIYSLVVSQPSLNMNILFLIIALSQTPSYCRVIERQVQEDPSKLRLPNRVFQLKNVQDFSDRQTQHKTVNNDIKDHAEDQNTTMTEDKEHLEEEAAAAEGSEEKSRVSRSPSSSSLQQREPTSPPSPPPSLVALLALDIIAALFALHALAALFFILPN